MDFEMLDLESQLKSEKRCRYFWNEFSLIYQFYYQILVIDREIEIRKICDEIKKYLNHYRKNKYIFIK
jgi:hypothetical protein